MTVPLRIAFISMHTSPLDAPGIGDGGGMNVVERHLADALALAGHQVDMITRRSDPDTPPVVDLSENLRLRTVTAGPPGPLPKSEIDSYIEDFRVGLAGCGPYHIIHSHHWMSGVAALPVARATGTPHVQSFHSVAAHPGKPLSEGEPPESAARISGEQLVARESAVVVAISAAEARTVIERCGADPARVRIIAPGVDLDLFHPRRGPESPWQDYPNGYVLFAGRLQPLKAPDLALRALARVEQWMRPHLVIAGEASADFAGYTADLHTLVDRLGLAHHVTFVGGQSRSDLARLVRGARLVLVPSHSETFGLIALEAAASGVPVLASAAGGLREAVVHGETGRLMDSRQPDDWSRAITNLLSDPTLLPQMGTVARIHAARFSWTCSARELVDCYQELLV